MKNLRIDNSLIILVIVIVVLFILFSSKKENFDCLSQCPYNSYYANWNYSPYYTPLPVNEDSYRHYYDDMPCLIDRWIV